MSSCYSGRSYKRQSVPKETLSPDSYYIDTNDIRHDFNIQNTPLANFNVDLTTGSTNITVNGVVTNPATIKRLVFGADYLTENFVPMIYMFTALESINLYGLSNAITINEDAFGALTSLTSIDLEPLSNVTNIGNGFLSMSKITQIDLTPLGNVTTIGDNFFSLGDLLTVDISPFSNVTSIGRGFLTNNLNLTRVDGFTKLTELLSIGDSLLGSTKITSLDLSKTKITSIGTDFLWTLNRLTYIRLPIFPPNTVLPDGFMKQTYLANDINWEAFQNVTALGNDFMKSCEFSMFDSTYFSKVTTIGDNFFGNSNNPKSADLSHFSSLRSVGSEFFNSTGVATIQIGSINWANITAPNDSTFFENIPNNVTVYADSLQLGQNFVNKITKYPERCHIVVNSI